MSCTLLKAALINLTMMVPVGCHPILMCHVQDLYENISCHPHCLPLLNCATTISHCRPEQREIPQQWYIHCYTQ
ncbi:hypothetical protein ARMGADRAFT_121590 [Armillaria gallica]|uniref:Secreted protein n=1 Tax=Armillaria gallica TaxID=47427 RepID=A0A2H3DGV4_ARMGA|nr:hypothetical protein ARMGADRAFT_121590 [Armillaria gallica]